MKKDRCGLRDESMKPKIAAIALVFLLVGCAPDTISIPTESSIPIIVDSTKANIPIPSPILTPTAQINPTLIPTPAVWEIWFWGYSCEGLELCEDAGEGQRPKSSYFSINSDGTALKPVDISSIPTPQIPADAPPLSDSFATVPQLSPDKSMLTYGAREDGIYSLYLVDTQTGELTNIYQTETIEDHLSWIGTACWSPDGQTIDFLLHSRIGMDNQPPVLYRTNWDGSQLQALYSFPGLENAWFGNCSPDGQEMVLSLPGSPKIEENGLYLINRNTGQMKQILSGYSASRVWPPQSEIP
jgi:hypothetical protein